MRFFVIGTRSGGLDSFAPDVLHAEVKVAAKLVMDDFIREIYNRTDGMGAVLVVEADSEEDVRKRLGALPLAQKGQLELEIYGTKPWRVIEDFANAP